MTAAHGAQAPSAWITRFAHLVRPQGTVLDLACGMGRHTRYFSASNHALTSVDKSQEATQSIADIAEAITADIENGSWPLAGRSFDGVVITNYLGAHCGRRFWPASNPAACCCMKPLATAMRPTASHRDRIFCWHPASCCKSVLAGPSSPTSMACCTSPTVWCSVLPPSSRLTLRQTPPSLCKVEPRAQLRAVARPRTTPQPRHRIDRPARRPCKGGTSGTAARHCYSASLLQGDARSDEHIGDFNAKTGLAVTTVCQPCVNTQGEESRYTREEMLPISGQEIIPLPAQNH